MAGKRHGSCREAFGGFCGLANGRLEPPEKDNAGAGKRQPGTPVKTCLKLFEAAGKGFKLCKLFKVLKPGKRQPWTLKLFEAAGKGFKLCKLFKVLKPGKWQPWTPGKRCLKLFEAAWKGFKLFKLCKVWKPGKRQPWTPVKRRCWGPSRAWERQGRVSSLLSAFKFLSLFTFWSLANGSLEHKEKQYAAAKWRVGAAGDGFKRLK